MDYFYCPPEKISSSSFSIDGEEYAHLVHVMRKKEGDLIRIVDGSGNAFDARIESVKHRSARGSVLTKFEQHGESPVRVTLAVGLLKNYAKFDFLVEKTTELGVRKIIPLRTGRTIPQHAKSGRWQKLALAAMKQSGRSFLPVVSDVMTLGDVLNRETGATHKLVAHEQVLTNSAVEFPRFGDSSDVLVIVGPEGGLDDGEITECLDTGFLPVYLGPRRLRTETAAIVILALSLLPHR